MGLVPATHLPALGRSRLRGGVLSARWHFEAPALVTTLDFRGRGTLLSLLADFNPRSSTGSTMSRILGQIAFSTLGKRPLLLETHLAPRHCLRLNQCGMRAWYPPRTTRRFLNIEERRIRLNLRFPGCHELICQQHVPSMT